MRRLSGTVVLKRRLALLRILVIAVLVVTFRVLLRTTLDPESFYEDSFVLPQDVLNFAKSTSDEYGFVQLIFFNWGYLELVKSWICNLRLVEEDALRRTLFVAADQTSAVEVIEFEPRLIVHTLSGHVSQPETYGTYGYFRLTLDRLRYQNSILQAGANVLVVEADAVWFSPVEEYMRQIVSSTRIVSANDRTPDNPLISAGFLFFPSKGKTFFQKYVSQYGSILEKYKDFTGTFDVLDPGEQHLMTKLLRRSNTRVSWLNECHFSNGQWYMNSDFRARCPHPKVIQNNYISGNQNKIDRAKEWGHWLLNENGSCVSDLPIINPLGDYDITCDAALQPLSSHVTGVRLSPSVVQVLSLVDHSFIMTVSGCQKTLLPPRLKGKITCVHGQELDKCLLRRSVSQYADYSERAGFNHAFVHLYSRKHEFETIAVLEEDYFVEEGIHEQLIEDMQKLLQSKSWTFVRVGRRPHFLENYILPEICPPQCVCKKVKLFGSNLCLMRGSGCDVRSTDFYIASHRIFLQFAERVHDASKYPWQHIDGRSSPRIRTRYPPVDVDVIQSFRNQWYVLPQLSFQVVLKDLDETFAGQLGKRSTLRYQKRLEEQFNQMCVL